MATRAVMRGQVYGAGRVTRAGSPTGLRSIRRRWKNFLSAASTCWSQAYWLSLTRSSPHSISHAFYVRTHPRASASAGRRCRALRWALGLFQSHGSGRWREQPQACSSSHLVCPAQTPDWKRSHKGSGWASATSDTAGCCESREGSNVRYGSLLDLGRCSLLRPASALHVVTLMSGVSRPHLHRPAGHGGRGPGHRGGSGAVRDQAADLPRCVEQCWRGRLQECAVTTTFLVNDGRVWAGATPARPTITASSWTAKVPSCFGSVASLVKDPCVDLG
ncbi:hypothetical protein ABIE67_000234 [Streptomyces sp. V4I8]